MDAKNQDKTNNVKLNYVRKVKCKNWLRKISFRIFTAGKL
jgi:hypothetical protein